MLTSRHLKTSRWLVLLLLQSAQASASYVDQDIPLSPARSALARTIIAVTQAERDYRLEACLHVPVILQEMLNQNGCLRGQWNSFAKSGSPNYLEEPELLLNGDKYREFYDKPQSRFPEQEIFGKIIKLKEQLTNFQQNIQKLNAQSPALTLIENTINFYQSFQVNLTALAQDHEPLSWVELHDLTHPKALLWSDLWPSSEAPGCIYRISQRTARHLLRYSEKGYPLPPPGTDNSTSNHRVSWLPEIRTQAQVYFKANGLPSLNPSRELMLFQLYEQLGIQVPATGLLVLDHVKLADCYQGVWQHQGTFKDKGSHFVLQASQAIPGVSAKTVLEKGEYQGRRWQADHFAWQVIGALLTAPNDGKPDNFMVVPVEGQGQSGFVSIDNDEVFQAPLLEGRVHLKSILLTLPLMQQSISQAVRQTFTHMVPDMVLLEWLTGLNEQSRRYDQLQQNLKAYDAYRHTVRMTDIKTFIELWYKNQKELWHPDKQELWREQKKALKGKDKKYQTIQANFKERGQVIEVDYIRALHDSYQNWQTLSTLWTTLSLPFKDFNASIIPTLQQLWKTIQQELKYNYSANPQDLFNRCYPTVAGHYNMWRQQDADPYKIIKHIYQADDPTQLQPMQLSTHQPVLEDNYFRDQSHTLSLTQHYHQWIDHIKTTQGQSLADTVVEKYLKRFEHGELVLSAALASLRILSHHGLVSIQQPHLVADLWAQGWAHTQTELERSEWQQAFQPFRSQNPELDWQLTIEQHFPRGWPHDKAYPQHPTQIKGVFSGKRLIPAPMAEVLFDDQGEFKKDESLTGRLSTAKYPPEKPLFYFKKYPELPAYEYASTDFMRRLGLSQVPYNELLMFCDPTGQLYPMLLTQAVAGKTVFKIWQDKQSDQKFDKLNPHSIGLLIISHMLLNPEDNKEDNFILSPDQRQLTPVDNDHAFLPGAIEEQQFFKVFPQLQTKTLAFCLKEMTQPLPSVVVQQLKSLDVDGFLQQWMQSLIHINRNYQSLFPAQQLADLWQEPGCCLRLPLSALYIDGLYRKFHLLQQLLTADATITPLSLLSRLEPYVGRQYSQVFAPLIKLPTTLQQRFTAVTKLLYNKAQPSPSQSATGSIPPAARVSVANSRRLMTIMHIPDQQLMTEAARFKHGPEQAQIQLQHLQQARGQHNGRVQQLLTPANKIETVPRLNAQDERQMINNWFESPQPYDIVMFLPSKQLTLSYFNTFVFQEKAKFLHVLDLRDAPSLREGAFKAIAGTCPNLQYLNISGWPIKQLAHFTNVGNYVPVIDVHTSMTTSKEPLLLSLQRLIVQNCPQLTAIDLHLPALVSLEAAGNRQLQQFDLHSPQLQRLDLTGHQILESNLNSVALYKPGLSLHGIPVALHAQLIQAQTGPEISLSIQNLNLQDIYCLLAQTVAPGKLINLTTLNLESNEIGAAGAAALAQGNLTNLTTLDLESNWIGAAGATSLAEGNLTNLTTLDLKRNQIGAAGAAALANGKLTNLTTLNLEKNQISNAGATVLAQGNLTNLTSLNLTSNQIGAAGAEALAQGNLTNLTSLDLNSNWISDAGAISLAQGSVTSLTSLNLVDNWISDAGAKILASGKKKAICYQTPQILFP